MPPTGVIGSPLDGHNSGLRRLIFAVLVFQFTVLICDGLCSSFKRKDMGMGEKKAPCVDIACLIRGLSIR